MFIGHFGVGMAAKRFAPSVSLGTLFLAAQFIDLLWPVFLLIGLEKVEIVPGITLVTPLDFTDYPISHSLLAVAGWSLLFGGVYYLFQRYPKGAIVSAVALFSHWLLDLIVHRPDLPLTPGSETKVGLGLWESYTGTIIAEGAVFLAGIILYLRATKARDRVGSYAFWGLVFFLFAIYITNLVGPPPPDSKSIALAGIAMWLLVAWGWWVDKHRKSVR